MMAYLTASLVNVSTTKRHGFTPLKKSITVIAKILKTKAFC